MSERKPFSPSIAEEEAPQSIPIAPTWKRIVAFLIDYLFLSFLFNGIFLLSTQPILLSYMENTPAPTPSDLKQLSQLVFSLYQQHFLVYTIFRMILWASYFILFWRASGQTIGAKIMNIRVFPGMPLKYSHKNMWNIPWSMCIVRFVLFYFAIELYGIPFLLSFDKKLNIRFHDFFSRSIVISLPIQKENNKHNERE